MDKFSHFIWNSRFDRWIDCIHDSTIQMDTDTDADTDGLFKFIWNSRFDRWIDFDHDSTIQR